MALSWSNNRRRRATSSRCLQMASGGAGTFVVRRLGACQCLQAPMWRSDDIGPPQAIVHAPDGLHGIGKRMNWVPLISARGLPCGALVVQSFARQPSGQRVPEVGCLISFLYKRLPPARSMAGRDGPAGPGRRTRRRTLFPARPGSCPLRCARSNVPVYRGVPNARISLRQCMQLGDPSMKPRDLQRNGIADADAVAPVGSYAGECGYLLPRCVYWRGCRKPVLMP